MKDEIYEVVDGDGRTIGTASWTKCHQMGLLHKSACVLVFNDKSREQILLHKRSMNMSQDPGLLQFAAGGHTNIGESPRDTALRELREEIFFNIDMPELQIKNIATFLNSDLPNNNELLTIFETFYTGPFSHNSEEVAQEPFWVSWDFLLSDIKKNSGKYTNCFKNVIKQYIDYMNGPDGI